MAAEFDRTSFGEKRRREGAVKLADARQFIAERVGIITDSEKLVRLVKLRVLMDEVLEDLKD